VQCVVTSPPYWDLRDYGVEGQIGLERTPERYIATIVAVFREVRRVLKKDGTLWLNLGDSYGSGTRTTRAPSGSDGKHGYWTNPAIDKRLPAPAKQLLGMPWRVALALQADGWWLRSDIIWAKSNPMPESVRDRPTRSHEYLFLLTKSARYYYDAKAIMEPASPATHARIAQPHIFSQLGGDKDYGEKSNRSSRKALTNFAARALGVSPKSALGVEGIVKNNASFSAAVSNLVLERNKRDVWFVSPQPCPEAHFATFPEKLVEPCILAGSRPGDVVFDPFLGSGTVGKVAAALGRRWVGLELSPDYIAIARARIAQPLKPTRARRRAPKPSPPPSWNDANRRPRRAPQPHFHKYS
jgi:DNA modification methylase